MTPGLQWRVRGKLPILTGGGQASPNIVDIFRASDEDGDGTLDLHEFRAGGLWLPAPLLYCTALHGTALHYTATVLHGTALYCMPTAAVV